MIALSPATRIYLAAGATDLRKSFEGLSDLVAHHFQQDPLSGHLYVFSNHRKNRIKVLYFDGYRNIRIMGQWLRPENVFGQSSGSASNHVPIIKALPRRPERWR
jgi:hypothetical protein